ncbi:MAG: DNA-directed RNA polymerase subunit F [Hadesarchaea archaeon]|nr:DNA-directed RNA polymerase subunit F [Hadesarchaea archaeon]
MIGKELIDETPVTLSKTLAILKERKEEGELEFGQRLTYDYAQKFVKMNEEKAEELVEGLMDIEKVRKHQAVTIANLMPETKDDIRLIFAKERTSLTDELIEEILSVIDEYRK